ncbi:MAG: hypothetical protein ACREDY_00290 [Bradyrhizobium sp.]
MTAAAKSWLGKVGRLGRGDLGTQAAVLLPVLAIAGLTAWTMVSVPTSARSKAADDGVKAMFLAPQDASLRDQTQAQTEAAPNATPGVGLSNQAPAGLPAVNGLKISSQSWRRGGLGSNALVTFTLRNDNDYAVKDIEIACAFSRRDGSHLTDRKRVIVDGVVNKKSRKTFARLHIGYVNINANKAKCAPVAANGI